MVNEFGMYHDERLQIEARAAKWKALYCAVNKMMMRLGADGEITADQDESADVMTALHDLDGGVYDKKLAGV